jgi:2-furoyl-CoA dehydrogenase large subunit
MGEGGGAPLHTICAAIQDALFDKGVVVHNTFNPPSDIYRLLKNPNRGGFVKVERRAA